MSEDQALYGTRQEGRANSRQIALTASKLAPAVPLPPDELAAFAARLEGLAAHTGRSIESLTLAEILANSPLHPPDDGRIWFAAVGKIADTWHALGQDDPLFIKIGHGRRRTFTPTQLARAARFETELIARRAGRAAGFSRTFALPFPSLEETL